MKPSKAHIFSLLLACALPAMAQTTPFPGIQYTHQTHENPSSSLHIFQINLKNPNISLKTVPASADPDGEGPWQTTLLSVPKIAEREQFDLAINGDYFQTETQAAPADSLGALIQRGYQTGMKARVCNVAVTNGHQWSEPAQPSPTLLIDKSGQVRIERLKRVAPDIQSAIGGGKFLIEAGKPATPDSADRNAWTAIGLNRDRSTLTIVVADGLWQRKASGITTADLQRELLELGCFNAIMLDGGGSSTAVLRDPGTGRMRVLNCPTDGKPRPVAQAFGVVATTRPAK